MIIYDINVAKCFSLKLCFLVTNRNKGIKAITGAVPFQFRMCIFKCTYGLFRYRCADFERYY